MTKFDWDFDADRRLLRLHYRGVLSIDFFDQATQVRRGINFGWGEVSLLIDARDADLSELTADDFKKLEFMRSVEADAAGGLRAERAAGVVGREIDLGIAQLWALYRNRGTPNSTAVFMTERDAMAWLFGDD